MPPLDTALCGNELQLRVSHDTYGITFELEKGQLEHCLGGVLDPAWEMRYKSIQPLSQVLAKTLAQDPLEFRRLVEAAAELAARPAEHGVDAAQASAFCCRLLSA